MLRAVGRCISRAPACSRIARWGGGGGPRPRAPPPAPPAPPGGGAAGGPGRAPPRPPRAALSLFKGLISVNERIYAMSTPQPQGKKRVLISIDPDLHVLAVQHAQSLETDFSGWVSDLLRRGLSANPAPASTHAHEEDNPPFESGDDGPSARHFLVPQEAVAVFGSSVVRVQRPPANAPCFCSSGKKFKRCCLSAWEKGLKGGLVFVRRATD